MATVGKKNDNHRDGAVRKRSQVFNSHTEHWIERDTTTGRFINVKADNKPFKGVRKER
ncbi:hypothetical protein ACLVWU_05750 [Bdellovibrio sp. HCB290]|uniref:hypothetical protein n=1 Tax=Bdellovibrio sp. HCB290 TaxID=3394356 RepID=UPI0039B369EE